jgi:sugar phosphate permease
MGRKTVFLLTFLTYAIVHMMRTVYSFNKHSFQKLFGISNLYLGIMDSLIYLSLALGTFFRYSILNSQKPIFACLWTAIPTSIGFSLIPLLSLA